MISVILPMFRAKHIAWLPLESFCRQKDINFEWELIIAEETSKKYEPFGEKKVHEYQDRLKLVGCSHIKYIGLNNWIPLGKKMSILIANVSKNSKIITSSSADYYSSPMRLTSAYKVFEEVNPDLILITKVIYYNIADGKVILFNSNGRKRKDDVPGKSMRTSLLKKVFPKPNKINRSTGIDGFIFKSSKNYRRKQGRNLKIHFDKSNSWKYCFNTNGINNISSRSHCFENVRFPFRHCPVDLKKTIPPEILKRLVSCQKIARSHKLWFHKT
jgi:hypothetical protein